MLALYRRQWSFWITSRGPRRLPQNEDAGQLLGLADHGSPAKRFANRAHMRSLDFSGTMASSTWTRAILCNHSLTRPTETLKLERADNACLARTIRPVDATCSVTEPSGSTWRARRCYSER
jgi:hypothetical protein